MNAVHAPITTTAVVLAWEDVVVPTATLSKRIGLHPTRSALDSATVYFQGDEYLQQALAAIEEQAINLVRSAARFGPVFLVSLQSATYMEAVCARFFPRLALWLSTANVAAARGERYRVQVVSSPRRFASEAEAEAWRVSVYQDICRASAGAIGQTNNNNNDNNIRRGGRLLRFRESGSVAFLSFSASPADQFAVLKAIDVAPFLVPKCVRVHGGVHDSGNLTLEQFFAQLRTIERYLQLAAQHPGGFATEL